MQGICGVLEALGKDPQQTLHGNQSDDKELFGECKRSHLQSGNTWQSGIFAERTLKCTRQIAYIFVECH